MIRETETANGCQGGSNGKKKRLNKKQIVEVAFLKTLASLRLCEILFLFGNHRLCQLFNRHTVDTTVYQIPQKADYR